MAQRRHEGHEEIFVAMPHGTGGNLYLEVILFLPCVSPPFGGRGDLRGVTQEINLQIGKLQIVRLDRLSASRHFGFGLDVFNHNGTEEARGAQRNFCGDASRQMRLSFVGRNSVSPLTE